LILHAVKLIHLNCLICTDYIGGTDLFTFYFLTITNDTRPYNIVVLGVLMITEYKLFKKCDLHSKQFELACLTCVCINSNKVNSLNTITEISFIGDIVVAHLNAVIEAPASNRTTVKDY